MTNVVVDSIGYINVNSSGVVDLDPSSPKGLLVCSATTATGIGDI